ncbi:hypothetical protein [Longimicrobium sp.]|uniref:hypothetical protein n=1 Tax=Longimicrobium sp. TaxID=2029185 RepID=UPI002E343A83|nr:hypothetical protein [Longimicrobium sp.]HEX6037379.1 hypothetical protein [Longimicrobium sp.]
MRLIPHVGVGTLRFGMDEAAVRAVLGEPAERELYDDGARTALAFPGEVDAILHAEHGLVGVSLAAGQATLFGADLFALDRAGIEALLAPRVETAWRRIDHDTRTLSAPSLGLIIYFHVTDDTPQFPGRGAAASASADVHHPDPPISFFIER